MIVYFADRKMNIMGMATSDLSSNSISIVSDTKTEEIDYGSNVLDLVLSYTNESREKANQWSKAGNYILVECQNEAGYYTIIQKEDDTLNNEISLYAEDVGLDLLNEVLDVYTADKAYDLAHYINKFIYDSGFEIHLNELTDVTKQLAWTSEETATSRILSVASAFEAEVGYSFIVENMTVTHKYINLYKRRGKDTSVELRLNREINSIVSKETIENLATAFMNVTGSTPKGADQPITLAGYSYDDGDIYVSGTWLFSRNGLSKWSRYLTESGPDVGHIVKTFSYNTTSQSELCAKAVEELKKVSDIEINYDVDISDLPDTLAIGDTIDIVDGEGALYLSARILKLERSAVNQTAKATLGDYLIKDNGIAQRLEDLSKEFEKVAESRTLYTWIAYADNEYGDGISLKPYGKEYMGTAVNRLSEEPAIDDPNVYTWVKVKGDSPITIRVESTNGTRYHNRKVITTLIAKVFYGNEDITDSVDERFFKWTRFSGLNFKEQDDYWNSQHTEPSKSINITDDDLLYGSSDFCCDVDDREKTRIINEKDKI